MGRPKLNNDAVIERFDSAGYKLLSPYIGKGIRVLARCEKHDFDGEVVPNNIFQGGRMQCCGKESMIENLRVTMIGAGNHFFGKKHSIATRDVISRCRKARPPTHRPPTAASKAAADKLRGVSRSAQTKARISARVKERYGVFGYSVRLAETGKTAGKEGVFYIVRLGDVLKLGSATTTMNYRMSKLRAKHGSVELVLYCLVDDAGGYEAMMMRRCQEYWIGGEYFSDFLKESHT